ncbi:zinc transporter ZIP4 [Aulostomus maculatus]
MFSSVLVPLSLLSTLALLDSACGSTAVDEAYGAMVSMVRPGQPHLNGDSLRSLFNTLGKRVQCGKVSCEKCDLTGAAHQFISNHSSLLHHEIREGEGNDTVSIADFTNLAAGCILYLSSPGLVCAAVRQGRWREETEHFLSKITHDGSHQQHHEDSEPHWDHQHEYMGIHGLEGVLQELHNHYEPADNEVCVTSTDIMKDIGAPGQRQFAGAVLGRVLYYALQGHCFMIQPLPEESFFLDYIMDQVGSENFTVEALEALMRRLNLRPELDKHEHEHEHDHPEDEHADHDHRDQRRRRRSTAEHHEGYERNATWEQRCFSAEELVQIYGLAGNSSNTSGLGRSDLSRLSPALVQQILSGSCTLTEPLKPDELSKTERYVYATIANVVITLISMFGIVLLLCTSCTSVFQLCIQFCISLAVGSLTGDALLHLLPMFLGLHVHSHGSVDHSPSKHSHQVEISDYLSKMLVVMAGIYYFYLMETVFFLITYNDKQNQHHHHHHHHGEESEPHHCDHGNVLEMYQQEKKQKDKVQSESTADLFSKEDNENSLQQPTERTREQRLLPFMITIGDGIHNFADGLAVGAAFSLSWKSGLATSLAVLCHELPHELGDFAILLHCGVSVRRALLLNVGSAMTSFIGLYIALSVATDLATNQWIAAITAGLFLYVGLADMLPTMVHINSKRPWLMFLLQNIGLLSGWAFLLVLSLYEEKISF